MASLRVAVVLKFDTRGEWILPQLAQLRHRGHDVTAILPPGQGRLRARLVADGYQVLDSPFRFRFRPTLGTVRELWGLRRLLRTLNPDVVNYHLYAAALAIRIAGVGLAPRRVHTVVGPLFLESALILNSERLLWRLDHVIICGTDYTSRLYGRIGCPPRRRPVITIGIDTDHYQPPWPAVGTQRDVQEKARAELGIPADAFVVIMVSYVYRVRRIVHKGQDLKGHDVLLTAWSTFHARYPRTHLLLVGGGYTEAGDAHRRELIDEFDTAADPSITWLDSVTDVRPCYLTADVSVSPSLSEGHGAPAEAGAMGVPSIVSDAGGLPEVVDSATGWVVRRSDPDALAEALAAAYHEDEAGTLRRRGELARQRMVDFFDSRVAASEMVDVIEQTVAPAEDMPVSRTP